MNERTYSSATHNNGIINRHRKEFLPKTARPAEKAAVKTANTAANKNKIVTLK